MNFALEEGAIAPTYAHDDDAGMDLYANEAAVIFPGGRAMIGTGLHVELPEGTYGAVMPRSGLAAKHGVTVLNAPGIVDHGYRGEVKVTLYNTSDRTFDVRHGDRIAQLIVSPYEHVELNEVGSLSETERGEGGFGSTGR